MECKLEDDLICPVRQELQADVTGLEAEVTALELEIQRMKFEMEQLRTQAAQGSGRYGA